VGRIGLIGYSLGASSAILSAARNQDVSAVVAVAPFACATDIWFANRPVFVPPFLMRIVLRLVELRKGIRAGSLCAEAVIGDISPRPLLIIQGVEDPYVPLEHTHRLFAAAGNPRTLWLIEGATHKTVPLLGLINRREALLSFLDAALR